MARRGRKHTTCNQDGDGILVGGEPLRCGLAVGHRGQHHDARSGTNYDVNLAVDISGSLGDIPSMAYIQASLDARRKAEQPILGADPLPIKLEGTWNPDLVFYSQGTVTAPQETHVTWADIEGVYAKKDAFESARLRYYAVPPPSPEQLMEIRYRVRQGGTEGGFQVPDEVLVEAHRAQELRGIRYERVLGILWHVIRRAVVQDVVTRIRHRVSVDIDLKQYDIDQETLIRIGWNKAVEAMQKEGQ
jgi:hypothetical protein